MSKEVIAQAELTNDQLELIKATVAKGATVDELKLFLYRAKNLGLDPLKPGQVYFIKYGSNPGTIVVGLDGFRSIAERSGQHTGTERGVTRDDKGKCLTAWCKVSRKGWVVPATEEVSMNEYNKGQGQWAKMPETMLKKVAECAALRMAFPDVLGGVYAPEEMDQARGVAKVSTEAKARAIEARIEPKEAEVLPPDDDPGLYVFKTGNQSRKGKAIGTLETKYLEELYDHYQAEVNKGKDFGLDATNDFEMVRSYLEIRESLTGDSPDA